MKPTLTDISSIFVDGRSGESIQLDAAYLDAVLAPRSEGQDQDIFYSESDRTSLRSNGYRSLPVLAAPKVTDTGVVPFREAVSSPRLPCPYPRSSLTPGTLTGGGYSARSASACAAVELELANAE